MVVALIKMMAPSTSPRAKRAEADRREHRQRRHHAQEIEHVDEVARAVRAGNQLGYAAGGEGGDNLRELRDAQEEGDGRREHGGRAPRRPGPEPPLHLRRVDARQRGPHRNGRQREHGDIDQEQTVEAVGKRRARIRVEQVAEQANPHDRRARRPALHTVQRDDEERQHDQRGDVLTSHRRRQGVLGVETGSEPQPCSRPRRARPSQSWSRLAISRSRLSFISRGVVQGPCRSVIRIS